MCHLRVLGVSVVSMFIHHRTGNREVSHRQKKLRASAGDALTYFNSETRRQLKKYAQQEHQSNNSGGERKRPLYYRAGLAKETTEDHHSALPSVLLV